MTFSRRRRGADARSGAWCGILRAVQATVEMAGFFAAHGVWCVSTGETLTPMFAYERPGGRQMDRLVSERAEEAVALGRERLAGRYGDALRAVFVFDGYVTLADGKTDALLI